MWRGTAWCRRAVQVKTYVADHKNNPFIFPPKENFNEKKQKTAHSPAETLHSSQALASTYHITRARTHRLLALPPSIQCSARLQARAAGCAALLSRCCKDGMPWPSFAGVASSAGGSHTQADIKTGTSSPAERWSQDMVAGQSALAGASPAARGERKHKVGTTKQDQVNTASSEKQQHSLRSPHALVA